MKNLEPTEGEKKFMRLKIYPNTNPILLPAASFPMEAPENAL